MVSNTTFDQRLTSLQSKIEEQFEKQLHRIESRMIAETIPKVETEESEKKVSSVDMSLKVIQLQSDLGTKDLEILALQRETLALKAKLLTSSDEAEKVQYKEVLVGDEIAFEELWVCSKNAKQLSGDLMFPTHFFPFFWSTGFLLNFQSVNDAERTTNLLEKVAEFSNETSLQSCLCLQWSQS